jgi:5'-nucleotidase / UDP-sugar diphosphatase
MRRLLLILLLALPLTAATRVTILHTSDYHSQSQPFYTEEGDRGGIARAVGFLRAQKRLGALVFSGGDTINKGAPAWSDKYGCAEWSWLNGIVDAMAFGNHDADYGMENFERCRKSVTYPILSANTSGLRPYTVIKTKDGARIGVFAIAGTDFPQLVKTEGFTFTDPVAAAREAVRALRDDEHVDAVVMIGHQHTEADYELARAVPGIDVIFGTHSHLKRDLTRIPGTGTWFISPSQYLTHISRVVLTIDEDDIEVTGGLIPVDARMREDRATARRVKRMQRELESDPQYRELFVPLARLNEPMSVATIAERTLQAMKAVTKTEVAMSTYSSFRRPLPKGTITLESLRASLPYDNEIVVCDLGGSDLQRLIQHEMFFSGPALEPNRTYKVATTDYLAGKEKLTCEKTGKRARAELRATLSP